MSDQLQSQCPGSPPDILDAYLSRLRDGDTSVLGQIYDLTNKQLYVLCYSYLGRREDAEDALSDTYLRLCEQIEKYRGSSGRAWLSTIAKNICRNRLRQSSRTVGLDECADLPDDSPGTTDPDLIPLIRRTLSEREFKIVLLHAVNEYHFAEVARIVGGLESTVRWQYNNAIKKIRKELERTYEK